jgi:hypothetical protein
MARPLLDDFWADGEQDTVPDAPAIIAGNFDSEAACEEALRIGKAHPRATRRESYSCKLIKSVSKDPTGHWWIVTTEDMAEPIDWFAGLGTQPRPQPTKPKSIKAGSRWDGPYASESICEAARLDRDRFDGLACERQ